MASPAHELMRYMTAVDELCDRFGAEREQFYLDGARNAAGTYDVWPVGAAAFCDKLLALAERDRAEFDWIMGRYWDGLLRLRLTFMPAGPKQGG